MLDGLRRGHNFGCRCTHGGGPCDAIECGADEHNARVEALRAALAPGDAAGGGDGGSGFGGKTGDGELIWGQKNERNWNVVN